jgi:hypothetical protein
VNIEQVTALVINNLDDIVRSVYYSKTSTSVYIHTPCGTLSIRDHFPPYKVRRRLRWIILAPCPMGRVCSIMREMRQVIDIKHKECNNINTERQ